MSKIIKNTDNSAQVNVRSFGTHAVDAGRVFLRGFIACIKP
jgi:hypothetical protein